MLAQIIAIVVMLAILSILIIVHEFGHFSVARFFGFQTPVFGFGLPFGPSWTLGEKWGTQFKVHACLLGGYVAIPELGDESNVREDAYGVPLKPFRKFPIWQRALVAFAGVGFNIIFAWLVMYTMLANFGEPHQNVVVHALPPENPIAAQAGVKEGDKILSINDHVVNTPDEVVSYLVHHPKEQIVVHLMRAKENLDLTMTTNDNGKVGMALATKGAVHYTKLDANPVQLVGITTDRIVKTTGTMLDAMGQMFGGIGQGLSKIGQPHPKKVPGQAPAMGVEDLHGVLAVVAIGSQIAQQDWSQLFMFTIMISLDLAIINLVPYPALDGGHLAFMAWEAVRGKPMHERYQGEIVKWGFISLLVLMAVIMFNDVKALVTGKLTLKQDKEEEVAVPAPKGTTANPGPTSTSTSISTGTTTAPATTKTTAPTGTTTGAPAAVSPEAQPVTPPSQTLSPAGNSPVDAKPSAVPASK